MTLKGGSASKTGWMSNMYSSSNTTIEPNQRQRAGDRGRESLQCQCTYVSHLLYTFHVINRQVWVVMGKSKGIEK